MKKSTIKRRKRVVPAYPEATSAEGPPSQPGTPISPEPVSEREEQAEADADAPAAKRRRPPPSVDYTGYDPRSTNIEDGIPVDGGVDKPDVPNIGSDYAMQAEVAAAAAHQSRKGSPRSQFIDVDTDQRKLERRTELLREAEAMRAALAAKEKEIDDLQ